MKFNTSFYGNPRSENGDGKFYPRPEYDRTIGMDEVVVDIAHATSLTAADVTAAIKELAALIRRYLIHGHKVQLDDIGTFKLSFKGTGQESAEDVTADDITRSSIKVTMLVDYGLRQYVRGNTTFSKVRARRVKDVDAATDSDPVSAEESDSEKTE